VDLIRLFLLSTLGCIQDMGGLVLLEGRQQVRSKIVSDRKLEVTKECIS